MTASTTSTIRRTITSGDASLYVEQRGTGPDVLLLCGLGDTLEEWDAQLESLSAHYRVTAFDNRGVGRTEAPVESISVPAMAADAATVIEKMGLDRPHVMGYSGGGLIAQELAISYPGLARSLVLCGTLCEFDEITRRKTRVWDLVGAGAESPEDFLRCFFGFIYTPAAHADGRVDEWIRAKLALPQTSDEAFMATLEAFRRHSTRARLGSISVPTLVIAGRLDVQVPPPYGRDIASLVPGAEFVEMPDQAHQPFQEVPEEYDAIVTGFWERLGD